MRILYPIYRDNKCYMEENDLKKKEFIDLYKERGNFKCKDATTKAVDAFLDILEDCVSKGENVKLVGWGKWEFQDRNSINIRNPKTGKVMEIPKRRILKFREGKLLNSSINGGRKYYNTFK